MSSWKSSKDIEIILNAILVNEGVRSAMLIQPADYNEAKGTDEKTLAIVNKIKKLFPDLLLSDNYDIYQGTIISKKSYDGIYISLNMMGEILGYPCFREFESLNRDEPLFNLSLMVSYNNREISLFNNICTDKNKIDFFKLLSILAFDALTNEKYKSLLNGIKINKTYVDIDNIIPTQYIINKLITKSIITDDEKDAIINVLYNIGFSDNLLDYEFQYDNSIHIGILIELLLKDKYDILSPFYPIQDYPKQQKEVEEIINNLEKNLIKFLDKMKSKTIITDDEKDAIRKVVCNMKFSDKIQYTNPIHIGILINLFLNNRYNLLSPFYPIEEYPRQKKEVDEINIQLENALIEILDKTKEI